MRANIFENRYPACLIFLLKRSSGRHEFSQINLEVSPRNFHDRGWHDALRETRILPED